MSDRKGTLSRDQKVENLLLNFSLILMATFEGVFAALASKMSETMVAGATAMTEALVGEGAGAPEDPPRRKGASEKLAEIEPRITKGVKQMFSEMRSQITADFSMKDPSFIEFIRNPVFDKGVKIVESHNLKIPRLTERLSDDDLASYMTLLQNENPELVRMFQELSEWQKSVPEPKKKTDSS